MHVELSYDEVIVKVEFIYVDAIKLLCKGKTIFQACVNNVNDPVRQHLQ